MATGLACSAVGGVNCPARGSAVLISAAGPVFSAPAVGLRVFSAVFRTGVASVAPVATFGVAVGFAATVEIVVTAASVDVVALTVGVLLFVVGKTTFGSLVVTAPSTSMDAGVLTVGWVSPETGAASASTFAPFGDGVVAGVGAVSVVMVSTVAVNAGEVAVGTGAAASSAGAADCWVAGSRTSQSKAARSSADALDSFVPGAEAAGVSSPELDGMCNPSGVTDKHPAASLI